MAIIQGTMPPAVDNTVAGRGFSRFMSETYPAYRDGFQRLDKSQLGDRYIFNWDDSVAALPDDATIIAAYDLWAIDADKVTARPTTSEARLKTFASLPAVKAIKTLADAEAFVNANVVTLQDAQDMMAKLAFAVINLVRTIDHTDDDYFPSDE